MIKKWILLLALFFLAGCGPAPTPEIPPTPEPFLRETAYLAQAELHTLPDQPGLIFLHITGEVPTECHQASVTVCPACSVSYGNLVQVNLYAMLENGRVCEGKPALFDQDVPLGVFTEGVHVVTLNGQYVGAFEGAALDTPVELRQESVSLDTVDLVPPGTNNAPAKLIVQGYLPTACHVFKAEVAPSEENQIQVTAYSLVWPGAACAEASQKFTSEIPLGALDAGDYTAWVNGKKIGAFKVP